MSARAVIDSLEFARGSQQLSGEVEVNQLARLSGSLFDSSGELHFRLAGGFDERQRPQLQLEVTGSINLQCQRCLGSLPFPVTTDSSLLVLTGAGGDESAEIADLDGVPAEAHADVWTLVEDEVLLAIPIAPRHPDGQCSTAVDTSQDRAPSPFAVLGKLKRDRI